MRKVNELIILATKKIKYSTRGGNNKYYLKYKNKDFIKLVLTDVLYTLVTINLLNTIRLVRKYIEKYLEVILKPIILTKNGDIIRYMDIKNNLY